VTSKKGEGMIPAGMLPDGVKWCVAGGWATCPALATDQDIWVFAKGLGSLAEVREMLLDHLRKYFGMDFDEEVVVLEDRRVVEGVDASEGYETLPTTTVKVASFYKAGAERHLLVTDAKDAHALVNSFDISTHMVAIMPNGQVVTGDEWTTVNEKPVMVRDTPTTAARLEKITARYAHQEA